MDWDKLRIFHAAAEAGSFTHAGEALRMSQSAVSRQVSALEKELILQALERAWEFKQELEAVAASGPKE